MYDVLFHKPAERQLQKLPQDIKERIIGAIERIRIRPLSFVKRLVNSKYYRLRVGDYRLILDIQQKKLVIFVIEIGHRRNVYK
jgi:mRNA interferase RelE/StbE